MLEAGWFDRQLQKHAKGPILARHCFRRLARPTGAEYYKMTFKNYIPVAASLSIIGRTSK